MGSCLCRRCGGRLRVESSYRKGPAQAQYLRCTSCQEKRSRVVPASEVWRRKRKTER